VLTVQCCRCRFCKAFCHSIAASDIVAGITLAVLGIPEVVALLVLTGLYTPCCCRLSLLLCSGLAPLKLVADSATAAILASMLVVVAARGTSEYIVLTSAGALYNLTLHGHGASHGIDGARELDQHAVAGHLDNAAVMGGNRGIDDLAPMRFKATSVPTSSRPSGASSPRQRLRG